MASETEVAAYLIDRCGTMTAVKLEKLVYYSQAWHLVWEDEPLFKERIEAWANGPVVPRVYQHHRGQYTVKSWKPGDPDKLTKAQKQSMDVVLDFYGERSAFELSELTHRERPWLGARKGLGPGERGSAEITKAAMAEYYGALV
jgi:uncharacterized phage-associated protein